MKNIYTWSAKLAQRNLTIADLKTSKGKKKFTQVRVNTINEASAATEAGIDMIISNAKNIKLVRKGADKLFLTASLFWEEFITKEEILKGAFKALENGADAVFTPRNAEIIEMLAKEDIPVMGHLGLVPRKSSWFGGLAVSPQISSINKYITSVFRSEPIDIVTIFVLLEISSITFSGITSPSTANAPAFSRSLNF